MAGLLQDPRVLDMLCDLIQGEMLWAGTPDAVLWEVLGRDDLEKEFLRCFREGLYRTLGKSSDIGAVPLKQWGVRPMDLAARSRFLCDPLLVEALRAWLTDKIHEYAQRPTRYLETDEYLMEALCDPQLAIHLRLEIAKGLYKVRALYEGLYPGAILRELLPEGTREYEVYFLPRSNRLVWSLEIESAHFSWWGLHGGMTNPPHPRDKHPEQRERYHDSCRGVDEVAGTRRFRLFPGVPRSAKLAGDWSGFETTIAMLNANGCRPATMREAFAFCKAHPHVQAWVSYTALGYTRLTSDSSDMRKHWHAALFGADAKGRCLHTVYEGRPAFGHWTLGVVIG